MRRAALQSTLCAMLALVASGPSAASGLSAEVSDLWGRFIEFCGPVINAPTPETVRARTDMSNLPVWAHMYTEDGALAETAFSDLTDASYIATVAPGISTTVVHCRVSWVRSNEGRVEALTEAFRSMLAANPAMIVAGGKVAHIVPPDIDPTILRDIPTHLNLHSLTVSGAVPGMDSVIRVTIHESLTALDLAALAPKPEVSQ